MLKSKFEIHFFAKKQTNETKRYEIENMQPVFLSINIKTFQGTIRCCCCAHAKINNNSSPLSLASLPLPPLQSHSPPPPIQDQPNQLLLPQPPPLQIDREPQLLHQSVDRNLENKSKYNSAMLQCPYSSNEYCNVLLECSKLCEFNAIKTNASSLAIDSNHVSDAVNTNANANATTNNNQQRLHIKIKPAISINVTDTDENLNVCMCSLYASCDNVLVEQESMIGSICPRCQNIIKQQPTEHRKRLISKRLTLAKDIIVNRVDTHFLSLKPLDKSTKRYEPYTPESIESHSPLPEADILEFEQSDDSSRSKSSEDGAGSSSVTSDTRADSSDSCIIDDNGNGSNGCTVGTGGGAKSDAKNCVTTIDASNDPFDMNNKVHSTARTLTAHSNAVSACQLKSRLEILRKTSTDASGMVINNNHIAENRKRPIKRGFCFNKCCVIL